MNQYRKQFLYPGILAMVLLMVTVVCVSKFLPDAMLFDAEWSGSQFNQIFLSDSLGWSCVVLLLTMLAMLILTVLGSWLLPKVHSLWLIAGSWMLSTLVTMGCFGFFTPISSQERFKTLMVLSGREDWQGVLDYTRKHPCDNYLERNIENLALAETGHLADNFSKQKDRDVQNLFVLKIEGPYVSALLSDIYWSMGEISMSQMYAFEANEKLGNHSSRLLKRLVQTNLVYGYYAVAAKYLMILSQNPLNEEFVAHYSPLMNDEAVEKDSLLGMKRRCISTENGFPTAQSTPYDMQQILKRCPEHHTSLQYLQAISCSTAPRK